MANLLYNPKDILQKEFKTKMRGYDPTEVDEFLDDIIKDYEAYNKKILRLEEENERLLAKLEQSSKAQSVITRTQTKEAPKSAAVTNFDILKRLSNLEREVFGKKLDETAEATTTQAAPQQSTYTRASYEQPTYQQAPVDNTETRQF